MKELDLVSAALRAETPQSSIKIDFDGSVATRPMDDLSDYVDPEVWATKRSSTAVFSKSTDVDVSATLDTPEETGRQLGNDGRTHTLSNGEVVAFVDDLEALPYHAVI
ncbi:hypothetical protein V7S43_013056 [Phytophthora oleae]|uniref:Uncharacterized protein n=1 Tax=Phytophthora oleae TaxID=2107226 RepID=A0ABD3F6X4_9STRA